jgi:hypothetical protein
VVLAPTFDVTAYSKRHDSVESIPNGEQQARGSREAPEWAESMVHEDGAREVCEDVLGEEMGEAIE